MRVDLDGALASVMGTTPLVLSLTNTVSVNDVAQTILHLGGLPVMSEDEREVADMLLAASGCYVNMGTVDEVSESRMLAAGEAANEQGIPVVFDPVGVGATPTRDRVAERVTDDLDLAVVKGNYGEITALAGEDAEVRGVESVGEYSDIATTAMACAQTLDAVVVASGETDVVATGDAVYEVSAGDPQMGTVVGTGCMLGATLATLVGASTDAQEAALAGTLAFGYAGEAAANGEFGPVHGPGSFHAAFRDALAGLIHLDHDDPEERIERVVSTEE